MNIGDVMLSSRSLSDSRPATQVETKDDEIAALRKFDAQFLGQILKGFHSDDQENLFDGGSAGRMYRDHFYEEIARMLAERGGLGLTEQLQDHLKESQVTDEGVDPAREKSQRGDG